MTTAVRKLIQEVQELSAAERREFEAALRQTGFTAEPATDDDPARKLATVQAATEHSFLTGDIAQVLADIERGYHANGSR